MRTCTDKRRMGRHRPGLALVACALFCWLAFFRGSCDSILDSDGDGVINPLDAFPFNPFEQVDTDHDGIGDNADDDDDGDKVPDVADGPLITPALRDKLALLNPDQDTFPLFVGNSVPDLLELSAIGECQAPDMSSDCGRAMAALPASERGQIQLLLRGGRPIYLFQFDPDSNDDIFPIQLGQPPEPFWELPGWAPPGPTGQVFLGNLIGDERDRGLLLSDTDNDGIPDVFELDRDGDGVLDTYDAFPADPSESGDNDHDGLGDNADCNDDGPGGVSSNGGQCVPAGALILIDLPMGMGNARGVADGACPADQNADGFVDDLGSDADADGLVDADMTDCAQLFQGNGTPPPDGFSDAVDEVLPSRFASVGTGDGFTSTFMATLAAPVLTGSLQVASVSANGLELFTDDGSGTLVPSQGGASGTVNYLAGALTVTLSAAALNNADVSASFKDIADGRADFFCPASIARCDLVPDLLDTDSDNDGCPNSRPPGDPVVIPNCPLAGDFFPYDSSETQDSDLDGIGDNADPCPSDASDQCSPRGPFDNYDCESDYDNDGTPNGTLMDTDLDGVPDLIVSTDPDLPAGVCDLLRNFGDPDLDGDGVLNEQDRFPFDPTEFADNDLDGIGDNADSDDDNDGLPDVIECQPAGILDPLRADAVVTAEDLVCDDVVCPRTAANISLLGGIALNDVHCTMTNPRFPDSDLDGLSDGEEIDLLKQFTACPPAEDLFDPSCQIQLVEVQTTDPLTAMTVSKRSYPPLDPNTDADRPDGNVITSLDDPQALDGFDPAPLIVGTQDADSDGDGLLDSYERFVGTNPFLKDTDGDGMGDAAEVVIDIDGTNACGGAMPSVFEITTQSVLLRKDPPGGCVNCLPKRVDTICRFNPCDPQMLEDTMPLTPGPVCTLPPGPIVPPGDGYVDWCRCIPLGALSLNPNNPDVDGDSLSDGKEFNGFALANGQVVRTNPTLSDSDNMGVDAALEEDNPNCAGPTDALVDRCDPAGDERMAITFPDGADNCPILPNASQRDQDFDQVGDLQTVTPLAPAPDPMDVSFAGNGCDTQLSQLPALGGDTDADGLDDFFEISPRAPQFTRSNPADADTDSDGVADSSDNCPLTSNPLINHASCPGGIGGTPCQPNQDGDLFGDSCDSDPTDPANPGGGYLNPDTGLDSDLDGLTDFQEQAGLRRGGFRTPDDDADADGDRILDSTDNCPCISNASQEDADGDGVGDLCEGQQGTSCQ